MSQKDLQTVLDRLKKDPAFVAAVNANPAQALASFSLTSQELNTVTTTAKGMSSGTASSPDAKGMS